MERLGHASFDRACRFIEEQARPLERAMLAMRFAGGARQDVADEVARFRNEDGGFGRALEPDVRTPSSSALATGLALRILREVECPPDHPLVRGAIDWLVSSLDSSSLTWRVVAADTNDYPHAPWWHDADGSLARTFGDFQVIPRALLVGLLHHFGGVPTDWLADLTEATVRAVERKEAFGGGGSDLEYTVDLARTGALPGGARERLSTRIRTLLPVVVVREPDRWTSYCITPLTAVSSPDSIGADLFKPELEQNLDALIAQQAPDGAWDPTWTFAYPPEWAVARREWRGILTLRALTTLRAFGRIEGA